MRHINKMYLLFAVTNLTLLPKVFGAPVTFFDTIPDGRDSFDSQISTAGGTKDTDELSGLVNNTNSWTRPDLTITSTNSANRAVSTTALDDPDPGGIPGGDSIVMSADGSITSGLTFTFNTAINGFGVELQDWATCCYPSSLYLSFDGGSPILVGTASQASDDPGFVAYGKHETFIGAIDDSATFTAVTFYGTGAGDMLYGGGVLRYAVVPIGAISGNYPQTVVGTNSSPLAVYLDAHDGSGTLQTIATTLNSYSATQVTNSLREIFPVDSVAASQSVVSTTNLNSSLMIDRIGTVLGSISTYTSANFFSRKQYVPSFNFGSESGYDDAMLQFAELPYKKFQVNNQGMWINGIGSTSSGKESKNSHGYQTDSYGVIGGYEFAIDDSHLIGFFLSSYFTQLDVDLNIGSTDIKNYNGGVYGQKIIESYKFAGMAGFGISKYDTERNISVGAVTAKPTGNYDGWNFSITGSVSRLFDHNGIKIEPFIQAGYIVNATDEYQEVGGGAFNINVSSDKFSQANIKAGVTVQKELTFNGRTGYIKMKPYLGQQWEVAGSGSNVRFASATSTTVIEGRDSNLTEVGLGTEFSVDLSDKLSLKLGVDLAFDELESRYLGFTGISIKF